MEQIGVTQLTTCFLGLTESQIDSNNPFIVPIRKVGQSQLSATMKGVTYAVSLDQCFFVIFDSDFDGQAVVQKTYWGNETMSIYNLIKETHGQGMPYPGSNGFFIHPNISEGLLVEYQVLEGEACVSVSRGCIL